MVTNIIIGYHSKLSIILRLCSIKSSKKQYIYGVFDYFGIDSKLLKTRGNVHPGF